MRLNPYLCDLEALREIGWSCWDPIGLRAIRHHHEDEYDNYLLQAAGLAIREADKGAICDYLLARCHEMGVGADEAAAAKTAQALIHHVAMARAGGSGAASGG